MRVSGDGATRGSCEVRERNREGVVGAEVATQGIIGDVETKEGVATGIGTSGGATSTD